MGAGWGRAGVEGPTKGEAGLPKPRWQPSGGGYVLTALPGKPHQRKPAHARTWHGEQHSPGSFYMLIDIHGPEVAVACKNGQRGPKLWTSDHSKIDGLFSRRKRKQNHQSECPDPSKTPEIQDDGSVFPRSPGNTVFRVPLLHIPSFPLAYGSACGSPEVGIRHSSTKRSATRPSLLALRVCVYHTLTLPRT